VSALSALHYAIIREYIQTAIRLGELMNTCQTAEELKNTLQPPKAQGAKMKSIAPPLGPGLAEAIQSLTPPPTDTAAAAAAEAEEEAEAEAVGSGVSGSGVGARLCPQPGAADKHEQTQRIKAEAVAAGLAAAAVAPAALLSEQLQPALLDDMVGYRMQLLIDDALLDQAAMAAAATRAGSSAAAAGGGGGDATAAVAAWCEQVGRVLEISVVTPSRMSVAGTPSGAGAGAAGGYRLEAMGTALAAQYRVDDVLATVTQQYLPPAQETDAAPSPEPEAVVAVPAAGGGGGGGGCRAVLVRADRYVLGVVQEEEGGVSSSLGQVDQLGRLLCGVSQLLGKQDGGGEEECCWPWSYYIDQ
jgi:hypothetical protein